MDYASRWARFFAAVIDIIVVIVLWVILGAVGILGSERDMPESTESFSTLSRDALVLYATGALYYIVLTVAFGATLGKMALGMRVVGADGERAGSGAVVAREVVGRAGNYIVQIVLFIVLRAAMGDGTASAIAGLIGFLVFLVIFLRILVDDRRQGWHDKVGGTFVVKAR